MSAVDLAPFVHETAIVDPSARLAAGVQVGPYCIIGPEVTLGEGCQLQGRVTIERNVTLGKNCVVHTGAVLGGPPQDMKYQGETSWVHVGYNTILREFVTLHRATGENEATTVGNNCMLMAYAHVGHNCRVGDKVIMANAVHLGGHAVVHDGVVLGGGLVVHQHCHIGRFAMVGGGSAVRQDLPPFCMYNGSPASFSAINLVGLRRNGFSSEERTLIKRVARQLFLSVTPWQETLAQLEQEYGQLPLVREMLSFITEEGKRGIPRRGRNRMKKTSVEIHENDT